MINFAAIVPHTPLLIPSIGKDNFEQLKNTAAALEKLEEKIYAAKVETLVIITPHGLVHNSAFIINFSPKFKGSLAEFSDFNAKPEYYGDNELSYKIKEKLETATDLQLTTQEIDFGCLVPLHYLAAHNKIIKIIPISISGLSFEEHYKFGESLTDILQSSPKRIGVIASAGLSHKLTKKSPNGYSTQAKKFDQELIELLKKKKNKDILSINPSLAKKVDAPDFPAILIMLGIVSDINYKPKLLSYEFPFGAGNLVMDMGI